MTKRIVYCILLACVFLFGDIACFVWGYYTREPDVVEVVKEVTKEVEVESPVTKISVNTENGQDLLEIPEIPSDCIGYLSIPSCGISGFIRYGSTMEAIANAHVGEFEDTGEIGVDNYCLLGHAREGKDSLVFTNLEPNISAGDLIYVVKDGCLYTFQAGYLRVVNPEDVWILERTGYPSITIMCCTNQGTQRFVVFGGFVSKETIGN